MVTAEAVSPSGPRPRGRDEVQVAVLAAARELVAERGPDGFSVRDVAGRAGVNHALVHRHLGSKAEVVERVLSDEAAAVADAVTALVDAGLGRAAGDVDAVVGVLAEHPLLARALVHAVLSAPGAAVPGTAATTAVFGGLWAGAAASAPAEDAALAGAAVLGWLVFGDFMAEAVGAEQDGVRRRLAAVVAGLAAPR